MDLELGGKVAVLTGASKGIGYASARALAREGARVAICARGVEQLERAAAALRAETGAEVLPVPADMGVRDDARRLMAQTAERFGRIDVLVNCAGSSPGGLLLNITEEQWFASMNLKFLGYVRAMTEAIPYMLAGGGGRIVNVIGNDGNKPSYWELTPGAANAAGINVSRALAEQYAPHGILINVVNPGPVATDRWDGLEKQMAKDRNISQEAAHRLAERSIPIGRICRPEEVADLVCFLASGRNTFMAGAVVNIDGAQRKAIMEC
ncbi:MAG TPA: SDR family NAD(P)-dependent oxidoreductase [Chloroflexota bacterium]|nr:SDR family NAD(P)-dependent oxidoreductase [Chloroflexota bacterium]